MKKWDACPKQEQTNLMEVRKKCRKFVGLKALPKKQRKRWEMHDVNVSKRTQYVKVGRKNSEKIQNSILIFANHSCILCLHETGLESQRAPLRPISPVLEGVFKQCCGAVY